MNFYLFPHVFLVPGAYNGALYDLKRGGIFSVNQLTKQVLSLTEQGTPIEDFSSPEIVMAFISKLQKAGLGEFSEEEIPPQKIQIEPPKPKLTMIWLVLNNNCNLSCEHCYAESTPSINRNSLPLVVIFEAMREAKNEFDLECIQLIGGEPLLMGKAKITALVKEAFDLGIPTIEVFTNGILIDDDYISIFKRYHVHVAISIYSNTPQDHDAITHRKGSWKKTVNSISRIVEADLPIRFGIVATSTNRNSVEKVLPWLQEEFGITAPNKKYDVVRSCGRGSNKEIIPWDLFKKQYIRTGPDFGSVTLSSFQQSLYGNACWANEISIQPNGDVTPCEMENEVIQGNINSQKLKEIILGQGGEYAQRLTKDKIETCCDCEYRYACWECRPMAHRLDTKRLSKPLTCMYDPYTGKWEIPPNNLIQRFPVFSH